MSQKDTFGSCSGKDAQAACRTLMLLPSYQHNYRCGTVYESHVLPAALAFDLLKILHLTIAPYVGVFDVKYTPNKAYALIAGYFAKLSQKYILIAMESSVHKLRSTLKAAKYSATKPRVAVFNQLATNGPLSVGSLAGQLAPTVDRATVYRTVELYEKLGIVNRIWHGFKHQVELSEIFTPHHHHALCQNCGQTVDIASPELEATLAKLAKSHHFLALSHSVELLGYCKNCH